MNFYDEFARYSSDTTIVTEGYQQLSYKDLWVAADNISKHIKKRCLIFLLAENSFESIVGYVGLLRANAASVLINAGIKSSFFTKLLDAYKPAYIYLPNNKQLDISCSEVCSLGEYRLLQTAYHMDYILHDDLALLLTTSGSTGSPKFVRQSYKNINGNAQSIAEYLEITSSDRPITTMPMSYTYGLSIINSHLLQGASMVLTEATLLE
ncbi:MAG: AMP-binding protein, partial [Gammaproteobacteria bacterium]